MQKAVAMPIDMYYNRSGKWTLGRNLFVHMHTCSYASWLKSLLLFLSLLRGLMQHCAFSEHCFSGGNNLCAALRKKKECGKSSTTPTLLSVARKQKDTKQVAFWKLWDFSFFVTENSLDAFLFALDIVRKKRISDFWASQKRILNFSATCAVCFSFLLFACFYIWVFLSFGWSPWTRYFSSKAF